MSYCYFFGIVPVSEGHRVQSVRANGGSVWHTVYDTMFVTESGGDVDGTLRAFAPASESILPSHSLTMVYGKFTIPPAGDQGMLPEFVLETISHQPFLANPAEQGFDSFLPTSSVPFMSLLGTVVGSVVHMADNGRAVDLQVSNYIQNRTIECIFRYFYFEFIISIYLRCNFRCRFPATPRWARINIPIAGSVIAVVGRPHSLTGSAGSGMLILTVEDIIYNPGATHISAESNNNEANSSHRRLQVKKRKRGQEGKVKEYYIFTLFILLNSCIRRHSECTQDI